MKSFMAKKIAEVEIDQKALREEEETRQRRERSREAMRKRWIDNLQIPDAEPTAKAA